ncbi:MAG: MCE family protein [Nocardioides sp.]
MRPHTHSHTRPILGLVYLLLIALLIALSVQTYRKALPWQDAATVQISTRQPGLELNPQSDVKFQGVRVGEVREITSDGSGATVRLAIDHDRLDLIPADVDAMILPKTLFGEKYVDLRAPTSPASARLADGDEITQSTTSVELGAIFDRLVPILRALDPAKLSTLLGSLADALDGRGAELGQTFVTSRAFFDRLDPSLDALVTDFRDLATTADIYAEAVPALLGILDDSAAIARQNLVPREQDLAAFLASVTDNAGRTEEVLRENQRSIVSLNRRSRPVLELLDTYATAVPCLLEAIRVGNEVLNRTSGARGPVIGLSIDMFVERQEYTLEDLPSNPRSDANNANLPSFVPDWDPHCPQLPERFNDVKPVPPYSQQPYSQTVPPNDEVGNSGLGTSSNAEIPDYAGLLMLPMLAAGEVRVR